MGRKQTCILDVAFDVVTMEEAAEKAKSFLRAEGQHYICTPNPEIVMEARTDGELRKILKKADMVVPDGIGVVWASKYSEKRLPERVAGYDLTQRLMRDLAGTEESFYFFGGAPGVAAAAARKMRKDYPGLKIVGVHNGYFDEKEEKKILEDIKKHSPSILLVGLGAPKQENWMYDHKGRVGGVMIGVGAGFDYHAGNIKRAPAWMQKLSLEWLYRLAQDPKRLFKRYLVTNTRYLYLIHKK